jgi:gliding motility-associated-like protein
MKIIRVFCCCLLLGIFNEELAGQANTYILNGSAIQNTCNCYTLTPASNTQSGSVWNSTKINLNNPFDFVFNVYLGCLDANGADGIVFMLQPISTSVGTTGEGMGFEGISPSIGISLDTWQNFNRNDPFYDHISIQSNGNITHGADLAGPVPVSPTTMNIEDCQWHTFRITWDPSAKIISTYFDGLFRLEANVDLITTIFNNDPMVYWGFSAGTGGANNLQQFCTALNPKFNTDLAGNTACFGTPVNFTNISESFAPIASYYWNFGDGTSSTVANPSTHNYSVPGIYEVKLAIRGLDGCNSDTTRKTVIIGDYPVAAFDVFDTCAGIPPRIVDRSRAIVGSISEWNWILDGTPVSTSQQPLLVNLAPGSHQLQLDVKSSHGCASQQVTKSFQIKAAPVIEAAGENGCIKKPVSFTASQLDNQTTIIRWYWDFGNNQQSTLQNPQPVFITGGDYTATVRAIASNGCSSNIISIPYAVQSVYANAGNDTVVLKDMPFPLQSSYGSTSSSSPLLFDWTPGTGLDNTAVPFPIATLQDDQTYYFTVTTPEGCVATDTIRLEVFKGSAIYVPTGFTPNNDGKNDQLKPHYIGIRSVDFFTIYNRWGEQVFTTNNSGLGWNGIYKGIHQQTGSFVWMLRATDYVGKVYQIKGVFTLIR